MKKWSIRIGVTSIMLMFSFIVITYGKTVYAGTDTQLSSILNAGIQGLREFFGFLIDVLKTIW